MKVKDLIKELSRHSGDLEVKMENGDPINRVVLTKTRVKEGYYIGLYNIEEQPEFMCKSQNKPLTGNWIADDVDTFYSMQLWRCSNCHTLSTELGNYCPHCGIKMERCPNE